MIGEDHVFLGPVVPEERGAAQSRPRGDLVHRGLLVALLVEQGERGAGEPVPAPMAWSPPNPYPIPRPGRHRPGNLATCFGTQYSKAILSITMETGELRARRARAAARAVRELAEAKSRRTRPRSTRTARVPAGGARRAARGRLARPAHTRGVRRRRRGRAGHRAGHRGGRPRLRVVLADPRGEQARHVPLLLAGSEELKREVPAAGRARRGDVLLRAVRAGGGLDAAAMRTRAVRDGDGWVLNGVKRWITNAGVSEFYTVMAVTDPDNGASGISAFVVEKADAGLQLRRAGAESSASRARRPARSTSTTSGSPRDRIIGERGHRLQDRAAHPRPHPDHHRGPGARHRAGRARLRARLRQGAQAVRPARSATSRACSSCSPTWR